MTLLLILHNSGFKMIKKIIYDLFGIRIIHIIRRLIFFCKSPVIFFKELLLDLKKDKSKNKTQISFNLVSIFAQVWFDFDRGDY